MVTKHPIPQVGQKFSQLTVLEVVNLKDYTKNSSGKGVLVVCDCGTRLGPIAISKIYGYASSKPIRSCKPCSAKLAGAQKQLSDDTRAKGFVKANYKYHAKQRNIVFELSDKDFFDTIVEPCVYCGRTGVSYSNPPKESPWAAQFRYTGLDRIDSSRPYCKDNVQPCCITCNRSKTDMPEDQFFNWIRLIIDKCPERFT